MIVEVEVAGQSGLVVSLCCGVLRRALDPGCERASS